MKNFYNFPKFFILTIYFTLIANSYADHIVGFQKIEIDKNNIRPLQIAVWYPSQDLNNIVKIGDNKVFNGMSVSLNGQVAFGKYSLIVLSHGYNGSWVSLNALAYELSRKGYIVAAPNHPGTTTFDQDPEQAKKSWERPMDLSRTIDALIVNEDFKNHINIDKIAAIGHSLGGWTVLALSGGIFDSQLFQEDCNQFTNSIACKLSEKLGLNNSELNKNMKDDRVKAFIMLDPAILRGFTPKSLENINISSLIISSGTDIKDSASELEAGYVSKYLSKENSQYVVINDATHFSFFPICKKDAIKLLSSEKQGEENICKDGSDRSRSKIHKEIFSIIIKFLSQKM